MQLLLDTHVLLWALSAPERLSAGSRAALASGKNSLYLSAASLWEIEIKKGLGKLRLPEQFDDELERLRLAELPVRLAHARELRTLPSHHEDPFDRMLVAQARVESLVIVTADPNVRAYPVRTIVG